MVWTVTGELYPSRYRAQCMSLSTASNWVWNFLLAFFTPFITSAIDFRYGYVFAGCCAAASFTVYFFLLEGSGRTLEEIDSMYSKLPSHPPRTLRFELLRYLRNERFGLIGLDDSIAYQTLEIKGLSTR